MYDLIKNICDLYIVPAEPRATSTYSSSLLVTSQTYLRPGGVSGESYYFKAIQVTVRTEGTYVLASNSSLDTLGYLYDTYFDPSDALVNLITGDDDSGENFQFSLRAFLRVGRTYVLVITTHGEAETGRFVVTVIGPGVAGVIAINPTTSRPVVTRKYVLKDSVDNGYILLLNNYIKLVY